MWEAYSPDSRCPQDPEILPLDAKLWKVRDANASFQLSSIGGRQLNLLLDCAWST